MIGCQRCGHISCVCAILANHQDGCAFRRSATCAIGIECEHGRDVCPICDQCTCDPPREREVLDQIEARRAAG